MAVLWGLPMILIMAFTAGPDIGLTPVILIGAIGAAFFGIAWTAWFRSGMRRLIRRIYEGDPKIVPPPPSGNYASRIMCSMLRTPRMSVGGHLYVAKGQWVFVPHRKNLKRHQAPIHINADSTIGLAVIQAKPNALARLFSAGPTQSVRISETREVYLLQVPRAEDAVNFLSSYTT
jgi:hypothetical protein